MKLTLDRKLTPAEIAEAFCELDDEQQAQVFIEIGRVASGWKADGGLPTMTWHEVGRHLRDCPCSTYEGRQVVEDIADGLAEARA